MYAEVFAVADDKFVYIIYPHSSTQAVSELISELKKRGYFVKGKDCTASVGANELHTGASCMLALISRENISGDALKYELECASNAHIPLVPVYLEKVSVPFKLTSLAQCRTAINKYAYSDDGAFYKKLFTLKPLINAKPEPRDAEPQETDTVNDDALSVTNNATADAPSVTAEVISEDNKPAPPAEEKRTAAQRKKRKKKNKTKKEEDGFIRLLDGMYKGESQNGIPNGSGAMYYSDESVYTGSFKDGKCDGEGEWSAPDGSKYKGGFKNDTFDGSGVYIYSDGSSYTGEFKNGKRNGHGVSVSVSGDKYDGEFRDGFRHGSGTYTFSDGSYYTGQFAYGERNGSGKAVSSNGDTYEGEFRNGEFHGSGVFTRLDGASYCGEFKDGLRDGEGVFVKPDGTRYEGRFSAGEPNGFGVLSYPNGMRTEGYFENGEFISETKPDDSQSASDHTEKKKRVPLFHRKKKDDNA